MIDVLCKAVVEGLGINKFIETGTFQGESLAQASLWFSELYPEFGEIDKLIITGDTGKAPWSTYLTYPVFKDVSNNSKYKIYSVDIDPELYGMAKELFSSNPNIIPECNNSEQFLSELIDTETITNDDNCFFFLDAHWMEFWPIRDEISQILRLSRFVIVIDDFFVPGHPDYKYDAYGRNSLEWAYIKDLFRNRQIDVYYPIRSNRDNAGWVLIIGGYEAASLAFLDKLPLFKNNFQMRILRPPIIHLKELVRRKARAKPTIWRPVTWVARRIFGAQNWFGD